MPRRADPLLLYDALTVEGGLLPPEWLARVASLDAPAQRPAHYAVPKGLELRDEITRYWRMAEAQWAEYARVEAGARGSRATEVFVRGLLASVFGFGDLDSAGLREAGGRSFHVALEACGGTVPIVIGAADASLDAPEHLGDGHRRRSAWGTLQEYLNANEDALWGIATNGSVLRIGRDNASLTRPAWIEADLARIFGEERFADFSVLWLTLHASRFGADGQRPAECPLERWRDAAREAGTRARDHLRVGVEAALLELGGGFLAHPGNGALRAALTGGTVSPAEYFNELLRLVYRMIFLLTVEERGILHPGGVSPEARGLYAEGYGMRRLRERAVRGGQRDRHSDLWASLYPVFAGLGRTGGEPALGLPELGGLFAVDQCPHLDAAALENRALLMAVFRLTWLREDGGLARVNWKDMGPEELGSVYESLLELVPRVTDDARAFGFAGADESAGNERKLTGSYYTPDSLVQQLLDTALEPVVASRLAERPDDLEGALLTVTVLDPACGSGHFLLAAARRLAGHLASARTGGTPGAREYRDALRDVVTHCLHGVDRNPMALELARMSLWLEAYTPDRALGFLDHHLVLGDALLGLLDLSALKDGIPSDAFKALTGDDADIVRMLARLNRQGLTAMAQAQASENLSLRLGTGALEEAFGRLDELADDGLAGVEAKRARYAELRAEAQASPLALAADVFVGAFLTPKRRAPDRNELSEAAIAERFPTTGTLLDALEGMLDGTYPAAAAARVACRKARVLHWPLAFPQVFARGGFDVVLGNPPWETLQLSEQEFFASRAPDIAGLPGARRKSAIAALKQEVPALWHAFVEEKFAYEAANASFRADPRFALTAFGKLNTYALFAETAYRLVSGRGRAGLVVPTGIATDDSTKQFFGALVDNRRLTSLLGCYEIRRWFHGTDDRKHFCLLTIGAAKTGEFAFHLMDAGEFMLDEKRFSLSPDDFRLINPNTRTCPIFRSRRDAELTKKIYRRVPVLIDETNEGEEGNPWGMSFSQGLFNMTSDSGLFLDELGPDTVPLYEAKMIHQFDHRWATYERKADGDGVDSRDVTDAEKTDAAFFARPRYWVPTAEVLKRAARVPPGLVDAVEREDWDGATRLLGQWLGGHFINRGEEGKGNRLLMRFLGSPLDSMVESLGGLLTVGAVAERFPLSDEDVALVAASDSIEELAPALVEAKTPKWFLGWRDIALASVERTVIASVIPRAGVGHTMPLMFTPVGHPEVAALTGCLASLVFDFVARQKVGGTHLTYMYLKQLPVLPPTAYTPADLDFIVPRVLELTYTANDLRAWAAALGYDGPPFGWDPDRRARLRAELDAYYARLYGLTRDELRYVLDPADVMGPDYPSETFRVLKQNEERAYGEYRTGRLVLEAWDRMEGAPVRPATLS